MIRKHILNSIGPGLLFAAVSVGVSHLVQTTRAGAVYGLAMLVFILYALISKYPASRFGQQYAVVTGTTLLEGFRKQGLWCLILIAVITCSAMFTGLAAVTLVTAGIAKTAFGLSLNPVLVSAFILVACMLLLTIGEFHWLDITIKILVLVMACSTIAATCFAIPGIDWEFSAALLPKQFDILTIMFIVGLVGWMPAPLDTAVLQSIWTVAKAHDSDKEIKWDIASVDFHIGYLGAAFLAVCFLLLGTAVMHGSGIKLEGSAAGFATQLIGLYQETLGDWSKPVIAISALAVMLSTVLTLLDGYPRSVAILIQRFQCAEDPSIKDDAKTMKPAYLASMIVLISGALAIQLFFSNSFRTLIAVATTISFITAPVVAWLIHKAMHSAEVPVAERPAPGLRLYSLTCIYLLAGFALCYLYLLATV
jgi:Mn2+/Fe2+ NRAMP family transporter